MTFQKRKKSHDFPRLFAQFPMIPMIPMTLWTTCMIKVNTITIILSYLYHHFGNGNKELLGTVYLHHNKPCKQNAT